MGRSHFFRPQTHCRLRFVCRSAKAQVYLHQIHPNSPGWSDVDKSGGREMLAQRHSVPLLRERGLAGGIT